MEAGRFAGYRTAGVNRVSLGVQSLDDAILKTLGRLHSVAEAEAAIAIARRTFERFSFDLIYARPGQTVRAWQAELDRALALADGHVSLYQLTIEAGTPFAALHAGGKLVLPADDVADEMFALTQDVTASAGLPAYEISNHARPGEESRHNLLYWRYGEYAGIGAGAHGRLVIDGERHATSAERMPEQWLARVEEADRGVTDQHSLSRSGNRGRGAADGAPAHRGPRPCTAAAARRRPAGIRPDRAAGRARFAGSNDGRSDQGDPGRPVRSERDRAAVVAELRSECGWMTGRPAAAASIFHA